MENACASKVGLEKIVQSLVRQPVILCVKLAPVLHPQNALNEYKMLSFVVTLAIEVTNGAEVTAVPGRDLVVRNV